MKISLKAARVNANLTQEDTAKAMGKTKQTIMNWESGRSEIKYRNMERLSELYGMPMEYLAVPEKRG